MRRTKLPAPADAAIARNVRVYDTVASLFDGLHPEVANPVEQSRLAGAVRDALAASVFADATFDASWHAPLRAQCMQDVWFVPPRRWTHVLSPHTYWNRLRLLLQWQRWFDRRWMPEGVLHIWPDDHVEWARVEARAREAGVQPLFVRDYLLYEAPFDRAVWERWKERVTDYRMWVGRKQWPI